LIVLEFHKPPKMAKIGVNYVKMPLTDEQIAALPSRYVHKKTHLPYDTAKQLIATQAPHATSAHKYRKWIKETKSYFMPIHPERVYPDFDWSDYLNTECKTFHATVAERRHTRANVRPMWDAIRWSQRYCREHEIGTKEAWLEAYAKDDSIPQDIPNHPQILYKEAGFPGYAVWLGKNASAVQEAAKHVTAVLTLLHPVGVPQNVLQLVTWSDGIGDLRNKWGKQTEFDRILGVWNVEPKQMPLVNRIVSETATSDGERITCPNVNQLTWELNSHLDMVRVR